jgi:hypothetical protein
VAGIIRRPVDGVNPKRRGNNRDREKPHGSPSHTTGRTGHVSGGSAD